MKNATEVSVQGLNESVDYLGVKELYGPIQLIFLDQNRLVHVFYTGNWLWDLASEKQGAKFNFIKYI